MIPQFPEYTAISLANKDEYELFIHQFQPYSDFNFVSLYSYDTEADAQLSNLNGNLIVRFRDYLSNEPFYTFLGNKYLVETANELLVAASRNNYRDTLQLIPESVIRSEPKLSETFLVSEDDANHDYILSVPALATFQGTKYANRRHQANKFENTFIHAKIVHLDLPSDVVQSQIVTLFKEWERGKGEEPDDMNHELLAIKRLMAASRVLKLVSVGVYMGKKLIGFAVAEVLPRGYGIFHFVKGHPDYRGVTEILYRQIGREMKNWNCEYLNIEQDFAFPGLRMSKQQWNPIAFLKKYTIKART